MAPALAALAITVGGLSLHVAAMYLPGLAPNEYEAGAKVELKANKLTSIKNPIPFSYYRLKHCVPEEGIKVKAENLGEHLSGDLIQNSAYKIRLLEDVHCELLCTQTLEPKEKEKYRVLIEDEYLVNFLVDGLPAATRYRQGDSDLKYMDGFLVGVVQDGRYYVHNHVVLDLHYHSNPEKYEGYRIVGFEVEPRSISMGDDGKPNCEERGEPFELKQSKKSIFYSYSVTWTPSDVRWVSRWDSYLKMPGSNIHWFSIMNSVVILLFLSALVALILVRTLNRDIMAYNEVPTEEEAKEDTGWKIIHGDVFRRPSQSKLLAVFMGSGAQLLGMALFTLIFALAGFLSPANRGSLLQAMMLVFTLMGSFGGYASARFCKIFYGEDGPWKSVAFLQAVLVPGTFFTVFFLLNLCIWGEKSSGAVPFVTLMALLIMWFGISVPLVFLGAQYGFKQPAIDWPVRTSKIPRAIPEKPWYSHPVTYWILGGIVPFGAMYTELFFIMSSLWLHQFYYLFGFLALVGFIVIITCSEVSIALTYFQLTSEDYRWWWTGWCSSASSGFYVFLYAVIYFNTQLQIRHWVSVIMYFGYMAIMSMIFTMVTGFIGLIASVFFMKGIYGSIKVD
eukprot:TRINITY_DN2702_c0_g2_i1.p1 TRINITY_DN2702_c0_g2~~TRINITY_DN2702_c0_g2_i1.p1  ORF type:complete len:618 (-),score=98.58 TRINITY_DN2702_c0_g2_i1:85-1938(-)